jgi:voltage-gated sodium channel
MSDAEILSRLLGSSAGEKRKTVGRFIESRRVQTFIVTVIVINAIVLGLETSDSLMTGPLGAWLKLIDRICLLIFIIELLLKGFAYRVSFWRSGWNIFDFLVVAIALVPGAGPWAVLRSLRVLRVLRLLTVIPSLRRVVAAFFHAVPGLSGVVLVMAIFFYTASVMATNLFGSSFPQWFGSIGSSLFSLFQVMTLESWSMGIVRPIMEVYPWAWLYFVPFIIIATFTILNLFIGIIVSTMQELDTLPQPDLSETELMEITRRIDSDLQRLKTLIEKQHKK